MSSINSTLTEPFNVYITTYNPTKRIKELVRQAEEYNSFGLPVTINLFIHNDYVLYPVVNEIHMLSTSGLENIQFRVFYDSVQGFDFAWVHKTTRSLNASQDVINNRETAIHIYQEDDCLITKKAYMYWARWYGTLSPLGLEPSFINYELYNGLKIPFDNHYVYSLLNKTPNVWGSLGYKVKTIAVDPRPDTQSDVEFFVQVANPYYRACIMTASDVLNESFTPAGSREGSYSYVQNFRNWPVADRASMGLAFHNPPAGHDHRRCIPLVKHDLWFKPHDDCLLLHHGTKYSKQLDDSGVSLVTTDHMFSLC